MTGASPAGERRPGRAPRADEDDSDLERLRRDANQRAPVSKTLDGVIGPGCFGIWAGRFQRGRV